MNLRWEEDAQAAIRIRPGRRWTFCETLNVSGATCRGEDPTGGLEMSLRGRRMRRPSFVLGWEEDARDETLNFVASAGGRTRRTTIEDLP